MEFVYGKLDVGSMERGQENCYLLTNGLGGYSSLTSIGSCARNDHALFMAGLKSPTCRYHLLSKIEERIQIESREYRLSSQEYVDHTKNERGYAYLNCFSKGMFPVWDYQAEGVEIKKSVVMKNRENTLGISYEVFNDAPKEAILACTPWMQFAPKGEMPRPGQKYQTTENTVSSEGITLYYETDGEIQIHKACWVEDYYYAYDARDGRPAVGRAASTHDIKFIVPPFSRREFYIIYSLKPEKHKISELFVEEQARQERLIERAGIQDEIGRQLVLSGDCFLAERESTKEKTIIAGYPFFGDWGRDTMLAILGLGITAGRYKETKSIFRSFLRYCSRGLMPNMFPESGQPPLYNTVDASLLFIGAVYEYYKKSGDLEFVEEAWNKMEEIVSWYQRGTDFHIRMDDDGLLMAGAKLEQVTWMDIRFGEILPTPRHGKPVEINAWWHQALRAMEYFAGLLGKNAKKYNVIAEQAQDSFQKKFWLEEAGCLKDTVSGRPCDLQIRCNQIWAVSGPFSILSPEREKQVVGVVARTLYTPYGLRTLSPDDAQFCPVYQGSLYERDMAYHQGTVWPFPLGAYYLAYLKVNGYSSQARERVRTQLKPMEACLREGCAGQIAEIYDGLVPGCSRGCFAQAWSVGEMLRVYAALEKEK